MDKQGNLAVPRTKLILKSGHAFAVVTPRLRNCFQLCV